MANYRKSFNFRNGVQVDNDNFVVNANGLVGIGTSIPTEFLDVYGNAKVSGLVTTTNLYSNLGNIVNLTGAAATITDISVTNITIGGNTVSNIIGYAVTGWITNDNGIGLHTTSRIGIGSISTPSEQLLVIGNSRIIGVLTATSFSGSLTGTATTATNLADASGITTGTINSDRLTGSYDINITGTAATATALETARDFNISGDLVSNTISFDGSGNVSFASTLSGSFNANTSGIITANQIYSSNTLYGVDLSLSGVDSSIEINGSNSASISVGNTEVGVGNSYASFSYSDQNLNISNFDIGDINSYLQAGTIGLTTGRFNWYDGNTGGLLMALTHQGRLGIGRTDPDETFEVVGTSTVTSDSYVGTDLYVGNDLNVTGSINGSFTLQDPITSNVNAASGVSTVANLNIFGAGANRLGIGTDDPQVDLDATGKIARFGSVAISTDNAIYPVDVNGSVRASGGFLSSGSNPIQIYLDSGDVVLEIVGIGSTSLTLG